MGLLNLMITNEIMTCCALASTVGDIVNILQMVIVFYIYGGTCTGDGIDQQQDTPFPLVTLLKPVVPPRSARDSLVSLHNQQQAY